VSLESNVKGIVVAKAEQKSGVNGIREVGFYYASEPDSSGFDRRADKQDISAPKTVQSLLCLGCIKEAKRFIGCDAIYAKNVHEIYER